jgi:hypothetical protein
VVRAGILFGGESWLVCIDGSANLIVLLSLEDLERIAPVVSSDEVSPLEV